MKHLVTMAERKGCHGGETKWCHGNISENDATATYPKMMPRQRIGSGSSRRYRCKRKWAWASHARWWGDPGFRVPTGRRHGNEWQFGHGANIRFISFSTCIRSTAVVLGGYTFEASVSGLNEFVNIINMKKRTNKWNKTQQNLAYFFYFSKHC